MKPLPPIVARVLRASARATMLKQAIDRIEALTAEGAPVTGRRSRHYIGLCEAEARAKRITRRGMQALIQEDT